MFGVKAWRGRGMGWWLWSMVVEQLKVATERCVRLERSGQRVVQEKRTGLTDSPTLSQRHHHLHQILEVRESSARQDAKL